MTIITTGPPAGIIIITIAITAAAYPSAPLRRGAGN
jgi:uncharacterized membrane protein